jgi:hypothetical protein
MSQLPFLSIKTLTAIRMPDLGFDPLSKKTRSFSEDTKELNVCVGLSCNRAMKLLDTAMYTKLLLGRPARDYSRILTIADLQTPRKSNPLTSEYKRAPV